MALCLSSWTTACTGVRVTATAEAEAVAGAARRRGRRYDQILVAGIVTGREPRASFGKAGLRSVIICDPGTRRAGCNFGRYRWKPGRKVEVEVEGRSGRSSDTLSVWEAGGRLVGSSIPRRILRCGASFSHRQYFSGSAWSRFLEQSTPGREPEDGKEAEEENEVWNLQSRYRGGRILSVRGGSRTRRTSRTAGIVRNRQYLQRGRDFGTFQAVSSRRFLASGQRWSICRGRTEEQKEKNGGGHCRGGCENLERGPLDCVSESSWGFRLLRGLESVVEPLWLPVLLLYTSIVVVPWGWWSCWCTHSYGGGRLERWRGDEGVALGPGMGMGMGMGMELENLPSVWNKNVIIQILGAISWTGTSVAAFCLFVTIFVWSQASGKSKRRTGDDASSFGLESREENGVLPAERSGEVIENVVAGRRKDGEEDRLDAIVVGAGVAGAALAHTLGKDGRRVLVVERDLNEPDRIVGELLQPGGYLKLVALGLEDCVDGIDAQKVLGYALFKDGKDAKVGYPLEGMSDDVAGRSFHNGRFIQKMRAKAGSLPSVDVRQGTVLSLIEHDGAVKGVRYRTSDGNRIEAFAPLTFVCDGCFSNLRRNLCTPQVDVPSSFVGLVLENCDLPHPNHGHVVLADPSPILFYPISGTEVRCLVDVPGQKVPSISNGDMADYLNNHVAPQLPEKLKVPFLAAVRRGRIRTMPNKSMPAFPRPTPGALLMGDAFNMRHPLTGGGMTVALSDILVLKDMLKPLRDFQDAPALCDYLKAFYTRRKPVASTINTLAGALYRVFCASPDEAMTVMRQACFDYLSLGGVFSSGPVALLSGLNPQPLSLVTHFFAVALFGVGRLMLPFPSVKRIWIGMRLIQGASKIIFPIILSEGVFQMFFPSLLPDYYNAPPRQ